MSQEKKSVVIFQKTPKMKDVGGKTGSGKVELRDKDGVMKNFQWKPSILATTELSKRVENRLKEGNKDAENFADHIMGKVLTEVFAPDTKAFELAPDMSLAYDMEAKRVGVLSRYLDSGNEKSAPKTLDQYYEDTTGYKLKRDKKGNTVEHAKVTTDERKKGKKGFLYVGGDENKDIREGISRVITGNALSGNLDCNLGNVMTFTDASGKKQVAVIDGGKSHNRMMRYSWFGGKRKKGNQILDYFNRSTIDGVKPKKGMIPKLWRDYEGLIPSKEFADQMGNLSARRENVMAGLQNAEDDYKKLLRDVGLDESSKRHVIDSLVALASGAVTSKEDKADLKKLQNLRLGVSDNASDVAVSSVFNAMRGFYDARLKDMQEAAKLMEVQSGVENLLAQKIHRIKDEGLSASANDLSLSKAEKEALQGKFDSLDEKVKGKWFKTEWESKKFKGDFNGYLEHRKKQLVKTELAKFQASLDVKIMNGATITPEDKTALNSLAHFGGYTTKDGFLNLPASDNIKAFKGGTVESYVALRIKAIEKEQKTGKDYKKTEKPSVAIQEGPIYVNSDEARAVVAAASKGQGSNEERRSHSVRSNRSSYPSDGLYDVSSGAPVLNQPNPPEAVYMNSAEIGKENRKKAVAVYMNSAEIGKENRKKAVAQEHVYGNLPSPAQEHVYGNLPSPTKPAPAEVPYMNTAEMAAQKQREATAENIYGNLPAQNTYENLQSPKKDTTPVAQDKATSRHRSPEFEATLAKFEKMQPAPNAEELKRIAALVQKENTPKSETNLYRKNKHRAAVRDRRNDVGRAL